MLFVLPATSAIRPSSYFGPQSYEYYPSRDSYYSHYDAPRFAVSPYPSRLDLFHQPSAEELEEHEYRRALEVIDSHRRRQAEKEAAIRQQQLAEASRQRYFAVLAAELEQLQQEELLAARRAELIRSQRAQARLAAAERQHALNAFLHQFKGPQPVACHPHAAKCNPLVDALKQRSCTESNADIAEPIKNILSSLRSRSAESENPKASGEELPKLIEDILSSIFPGLVTRTEPEPTPSAEQTQPSVSGKGKGRARAVDVEEPQKPEEKPKSGDDIFADILRHVMELSKSTPAPRSANEAGPSGSSSSSAKPTVSKSEQTQIDRAIALSSIELIQNTLTKLQTEFALPTELDHYTPSDDDRADAASVASVSSSDLTKLIPYTSANKSVYEYENELNGLLGELDKIDSNGDAEVREKRKEVVQAVEKALEGVEHVVGEVVGKRLSLVSTAVDESLKGFDVGDVTEEAAPAQEPADVPLTVDDVVLSEQSTSVPFEESVTAPLPVPSPADKPLPETVIPTVPEAADQLVEQASPESDLESSTATITPGSVKPEAGTEIEVTGSQVQGDASGTVDTFLLPEKASPPSPVQKSQRVDSDIESEVVSLDSDTEKSDWSEVEH